MPHSLCFAVLRPALERRLTRLEKKLAIPEKDRHQCDGELQEPREIHINGTRHRLRSESVASDKTGRTLNHASVLAQLQTAALARSGIIDLTDTTSVTVTAVSPAPEQVCIRMFRRLVNLI